MTTFLLVLTLFVVVVVSFIAGVFTLYAYMLLRMLRSDGWDKSNLTNAIRVLGHVVAHPEDIQHMWYLSPDQVATIRNNPNWSIKQPFGYIDKDEYSEVVNTRPDI